MRYPPAMASSDDLLLLPTGEAARRLARLQLDVARAESARLHDESDGEALHDFRVAVRRLRSLLSAWRKVLRSRVDRELRQELKDLQQETGAGRDAEVALEWLDGLEDEPAPHERPGRDWLRAHLSERLDASMASARERVAERFAAADAHLAGRLEGELEDERARATRPFCESLARTLRRHAEEVGRRLLEEREGSRAARLHAGRIALKKLRYLAEPVRHRLEAAGALVERCKELQDVLGELNDAAVLQAELDELLTTAPPDARAGLAALERLNERRRRRLLDRLEEDWLRRDLAPLSRRVDRLLAELEAAVR